MTRKLNWIQARKVPGEEISRIPIQRMKEENIFTETAIGLRVNDETSEGVNLRLTATKEKREGEAHDWCSCQGLLGELSTITVSFRTS